MAQIEPNAPRHETVMDVTEEQVARVYAKAFMGAAKSTDPTAAVAEIGSVVDDLLGSFPQVERILQSALVAAEDKARLLDRVLSGRASPLVLNFLKVLAAHGRLGLLRSIYRLLKKLDAQRRGMTDVEVRVATPLESSLQREVENGLRKLLGGEPVLHVKVDPALIAGMVIRIGDRVYDGSVHTQLEYARRAMIDRATERIETQPDRFLTSTA